MMLYVDSSALVKKYVREPGSNRVLKLLAQSGMSVTSKLAYPEILAGLNRKRRERGITEKDYRGALADFESDWLALLDARRQTGDGAHIHREPAHGRRSDEALQHPSARR